MSGMTGIQNSETERQYRRAGIVERYELERRGCSADDWSKVSIDVACDLSRIADVRFHGHVGIGVVDRLCRADITDCRIGDGCRINNVRGGLRGLRVGRRVVVEDVGCIEVQPGTGYGLGTPVAVLDETGSRPVYLYPGLSAQTAALMSMRPHWAEDVLLPRLQERWSENPFDLDIADGATVRGCDVIRNVHIGHDVTVEGAARLVDGAVINNVTAGKPLAAISGQVDAANFLIEDGYCGGTSLLRNVYVGQGAALDKGFTAHDSLFFANSAMENGEACALLAGPYTVSMHKGSLLIGMRTSFMNAGSSTNFSNHMYKLGPVHWGVLERGVKTSSGAYVMWGGRIGAFSLVMGAHKTHPDTSIFPFSYLFATAGGDTVAAPGLMLRSCGMQRDERKWPLRDKRLKRRMPAYDNVCYESLNPYTVQTMMNSLPILHRLAHTEPEADGFVRHGSVLMRPSAALRGYRLYSLAVTAYLYRKTHAEGYDMADAETAPGEWMDLCGQVMPRDVLAEALDPDAEDMPAEIFGKAFAAYPHLELCWVRRMAQGPWADAMKTAPQAVVELESLIDADRTAYKASLAAEADLAD